MQNADYEDIHKLKREIVVLKKEIEHLRFKSSNLFKILNLANMFVFIIYTQFILMYLFDFNSEVIKNNDIRFKVQISDYQSLQLYSIKMKYKNYSFISFVNQKVNNAVIQSDAIISKDLVFQLPQKVKFKYPNTSWFFIYDSLGILTICSLIVLVQIIAYIYKRNEVYYSLISISLLSIFSLIGISMFSLSIHKII